MEFCLLVFKDTSQKDLLNFTGTIPVMYQGKYGSRENMGLLYRDSSLNKNLIPLVCTALKVFSHIPKACSGPYQIWQDPVEVKESLDEF